MTVQVPIGMDLVVICVASGRLSGEPAPNRVLLFMTLAHRPERTMLSISGIN